MNSRLMIAAFGAALMSLSSFGGSTYVWSGAAGTQDWNTPGNWTVNKEVATACPNVGDTAVFNVMTNTITGDVELKGEGYLWLSLDNSSMVTIECLFSGTGGLKISGGSKGCYIANTANTYTGATRFQAGSCFYKTIANAGVPCSLGAPTGDNAIIEQNSAKSVLYGGTYGTDRPFNYSNGNICAAKNCTLNLNGPYIGKKIGSRDSGTVNVYAAITGEVTRTDGGTLHLQSLENKITSISSSQGTVALKSFGDSSAPIDMSFISLGQASSSSAGTVAYSGTDEVTLNTSVTVNRTGALQVWNSAGKVHFLKGITASWAEGAYLTFSSNGTLEFDGDVNERIYFDNKNASKVIFNGKVYASGGTKKMPVHLYNTSELYVNGTWTSASMTNHSHNSYALLAGTGTVATAHICGLGRWGAGTPDTIGTLTLTPGDGEVVFNYDGRGYFRLARETNDMIVINGTAQMNYEHFDFTCTETLYKPRNYQLIKWDGYKQNVGSFVLGTGAPTGSKLRFATDGLYLDVPRQSYEQWTWKDGSGTKDWDADSTFTFEEKEQTWKGNGEDAIFDDTVGGDLDLTLKTAVTPAQVRFNNSTHAMSFQIGAGGSLDAAATEIVKLGTDTLTLKGDIAVKKVIVCEGTLILDGNLAGADVVVSNGAHFVQSNTESVISGEDLTLTFGNGTNTLKGANTFTGNVIQKPSGNAAAFLDLYSDNALGAATNILVYGHINGNTGIDLKDGCIIRGVTLTLGNTSGGRPGIRVADPNAKTCGWYGDIVSYPGTKADNLYFTASYNNQIGSTLVLGDPEGPGTNVISGSYSSISLRGWAGTHKIYSRFNVPGTGVSKNDAGTTYFYATGNVYPSYGAGEGTTYAMAENTFSTSGYLSIGKGQNGSSATVNLNGFNQEVLGLVNGGTQFTCNNYLVTANDKPCTLTLNPAANKTYTYGDPSYKCLPRINGPVSIVKKGAGTQKFGAVFATTGEVRVEEGVLNLTTNAFPQASCLSVAGGKVKVDAAATVKYLMLGGQYAEKGTYGSSESAAENKNDTYFSGTGVITVTKSKGVLFRVH